MEKGSGEKSLCKHWRQLQYKHGYQRNSVDFAGKREQVQLDKICWLKKPLRHP